VPRRQNQRWLDGNCPAGVLAIYDDGTRSYDRYTVFYATPIKGDTYANMWISYRGMSENPTNPQGVGLFGELQAYQVADYRYRNRNRACRWTALPREVQDVVRRDLAEVSQDA
jgi:hypothetical protein